MTRVLFINVINESRRKEVEVRHPAFGTLYLASYLSKYGGYNDTQVLETGSVSAEILNRIKPDILGVSSITQHFNIAKQICSDIKKVMDVPIMVGGFHISCLPNNLTEDMDIGVLGEGEQTMLELAQAYERHGLDQKKLGAIDGIVYRSGHHLEITHKRSFIKPLDKIPFPARHLIHYDPTHIHAMLTSRGCPYNCVFCSPTASWGNIRYFSPEYVIAELRQIIQDYHPKVVSFSDDLFSGNKERLRNIAGLIKKEDFYGQVKFTTSARANLVDVETCKLLKDIGVFSVSMGLESSCDRILTYLKGGSVTVEQNRQAVELLAQYDLKPTATFIIGSPTETIQEMTETLNFIKHSKLASFKAQMLLPFPNTQVWNEAKAKGLVSDFMNWDDFEWDFEDKPESRVIVNELPRPELLRMMNLFIKEAKHRLIKRVVSQGIQHPKKIIKFIQFQITLWRKLRHFGGKELSE